MRKLLLMILLLTIVAITAVLWVLNPDNIYSISFWTYLGWIIFLVSINWLISGIFLSNAMLNNEKKPNNFGILPSLNIIIFVYTLVSLMLIGFNLLGKVYLEFNPVKDYHLVLQIIAASFCLVLSLTILLISKGNGSDIQKITSRGEILDDLHEIKIKYDLPPSSTIDDVMEYVKFRLPHPKNVDKAKFQAFIEDIERIKTATTKRDIARSLEIAYESLRKII